MASEKMKCLGECGKELEEHGELCWKSGKCPECCANECGCGFTVFISDSRYDNLCEAKYLRQLGVPQ